jgi:hypothetical protein
MGEICRVTSYVPQWRFSDRWSSNTSRYRPSHQITWDNLIASWWIEREWQMGPHQRPLWVREIISSLSSIESSRCGICRGGSVVYRITVMGLLKQWCTATHRNEPAISTNGSLRCVESMDLQEWVKNEDVQEMDTLKVTRGSYPLQLEREVYEHQALSKK